MAERDRIRLKRGGWRHSIGDSSPLRDRLTGAAIYAVIGTVSAPIVAAAVIWCAVRRDLQPPFEEFGFVAAAIGVFAFGLYGYLAGPTIMMDRRRRQFEKIARRSAPRSEEPEPEPDPTWTPGDALASYTTAHAAYNARQVIRALVEGRGHPCIRPAPDAVLLVADSAPACRTSDPDVTGQRVALLRAALEEAVAALDGWERVEDQPHLDAFRERGAVVCRRSG